MQDEFIRAMKERRSEIHARWEAFLRIERVNTPLANPDLLVHLIDVTIDEVFSALNDKTPVHSMSLAPALTDLSHRCPCGRNPFTAYFVAGEQALLETLVLCQVEMREVTAASREAALSQLHTAVRTLARRDVEGFCSICRHRAAVLAGAQALTA